MPLPNVIARAFRPVAISCRNVKATLHSAGRLILYYLFPVAVILVIFLNASSFFRYSSMPFNLSSSLPPA